MVDPGGPPARLKEPGVSGGDRSAKSGRHAPTPGSPPPVQVPEQHRRNSLYANDKTELSRCSDGWEPRNGSRLHRWPQGRDLLRVPPRTVSVQRWRWLNPSDLV